MATTTSPASEPNSVEALKRVKATENEWDARLAAAREESQAALQSLRAAVEDEARTTSADAERDRVTRIETARAEVGREADAIVAEGQKAADEALRGEGRRPSDKKDAILAAVLGSFGQE
jgi:vacuolar-type H+-ATPase subunit H